jgi:hypothetical protein
MSAAAGEESAEDLRRSGFNIKVAAQQPSVVDGDLWLFIPCDRQPDDDEQPDQDQNQGSEP